MTLLHPHPIGIPVPQPTLLSQPFWDGCNRGELVFQRCSNGHSVFNPAVICRLCLSEQLRWETSAGVGHVYTWSIVWRPQTPAFQVPYAAAIIHLDEGFRMIANVIGCDHEQVRVGLRVRAEFHKISEQMSLIYFAPLMELAT